jgi:carboxynorspermidine decarboxylase
MSLPSPRFEIDLEALEQNVRFLRQVGEEAGAKILLAQKGFSAFSTYGMINQYLWGTTSSGLHEALLAKEFFGKEIHVYAPAFKDEEMDHLVRFADHLVFNSPGQWDRFKGKVRAADRPIACGLRINPEHSEGTVALYDPCAPCSRLGTVRKLIDDLDWEGISGLHFHTLCEQDSDALERTLAAVEENFGEFFPRLKWMNFGGGHHITRPGYDTERLIRVIRDFRSRTGLEIYLEPGEAVALNAGTLTATVQDIIHNGMPLVILDTSATAHMPDVLEMPYRPRITGSGQPGELAHTYRLGGLTCLAGDVIGDYSFANELKIGDTLTFEDMAIYSMVKTSTFNGVPHPAIVLKRGESREVVRKFSYADYRNRLS